MPTTDKLLLQVTRKINSLTRERNKLNRRIRQIKQDLKLERKHLKALVQQMERPIGTVPSRLFGEGLGFMTHESECKKQDGDRGTTVLGDLESGGENAADQDVHLGGPSTEGGGGDGSPF